MRVTDGAATGRWPDPLTVAYFCLPLALAAAVLRDDAATLTSTPAFWTALAAWALVFCAVVSRAAHGHLPLPAHLWPAVLLALYFVVNAWVTANEHGCRKITYWLGAALPLLIWPSLAGVTFRRMRALLVGQVVAGVALIVPTILAVDRHFYGPGTYLHVGIFAGATIVVVLCAFASGRPAGHRLLVTAVVVTAIVGLVISGARGALVFAGAVVLVQFLRPSRVGLTACGFVLAWVALAVSPDVATYVEDTLALRFSPEAVIRGLGIRADLYADAVDLFAQAPITGAGAGRFANLYSGIDSSFSYPHNMPLEVAAEFGLIGLALTGLVAVGVMRGHLRMRRAGDLRLGQLSGAVIALTVYLFLHTLKSGDLNSHRLYFLLLGVCWAGCAVRGGPRPQTVSAIGPEREARMVTSRVRRETDDPGRWAMDRT
jgi:O-antigen ligase